MRAESRFDPYKHSVLRTLVAAAMLLLLIPWALFIHWFPQSAWLQIFVTSLPEFAIWLILVFLAVSFAAVPLFRLLPPFWIIIAYLAALLSWALLPVAIARAPNATLLAVACSALAYFCAAIFRDKLRKTHLKA